MKNLSHEGIGPSDTLPEYFGTNNRLLKELQEIATYDTAKYFYNQEGHLLSLHTLIYLTYEHSFTRRSINGNSQAWDILKFELPPLGGEFQ